MGTFSGKVLDTCSNTAIQQSMQTQWQKTPSLHTLEGNEQHQQIHSTESPWGNKTSLFYSAHISLTLSHSTLHSLSNCGCQ